MVRQNGQPTCDTPQGPVSFPSCRAGAFTLQARSAKRVPQETLMPRTQLLPLLVSIALVHCACDRGVAQTSGPGTPGVASLKQTLENGLKARTPDEFAFINTVVAKVDTGEMPVSLVDTTFEWARRKSRPMQFFE